MLTTSLIQVLAAAVAGIIVSWVWYSVFFREAGNYPFNKAKQPTDNFKNEFHRAISWEIISNVLTAAALLMFINYSGIPAYKAVFIVWAGFIAPAFVTEGIYRKRPWKPVFIDLGFKIFSLLIMASVFAII